MVEVVLYDEMADSIERGAYRGKLHQQIDAVSIFINHSQNAVQVTTRRLEPSDDFRSPGAGRAIAR